VEVHFHASFREVVGGRSVEVPLPGCGGVRCTVRALLAAIRARWPDFEGTLVDAQGGLVRHVNLFVDGRSVRWLPEALETRLHAESQIDVFPPVAGG